MIRYIAICLLFLLCCTSILSGSHALYYIQKGDLSKGVQKYLSEYQKKQKHDAKVLKEMGEEILRKGVLSSSEEVQLTAIYSASIAEFANAPQIFDLAIHSSNPNVQIATIRMLANIHDAHSEKMLLQAFKSPYPVIQFEAAYQLAMKQSSYATTYLDMLMHKFPRAYWVYFPELFACIKSNEAKQCLRRLLSDPNLLIKLNTIHCLARYGHDDFIPLIRNLLTHQNHAEKEAAIFALSLFHDSESIKEIKKHTNSSDDCVSILSCLALNELGHHQYLSHILQMAKQKNLYAIHASQEIPGSQNILYPFLEDPNLHVRFNALYALVKQKDPRALEALYQFFVTHSKAWHIVPHHSAGHSLLYWKVIPSGDAVSKRLQMNTKLFMEQICFELLGEALDMDLTSSLPFAKKLLLSGQTHFIPMIFELLERKPQEMVVPFIQSFTQSHIPPYLRTYAHLSLYRLNQEGPYASTLLQWMQQNNGIDMLRFKPVVPKTAQENTSYFQLSPEETSRLLIETYLAFAEKQSEKSIQVLLEGMANGTEKNRILLAGVLLRTIQ